jgi:hypothetical protein
MCRLKLTLRVLTLTPHSFLAEPGLQASPRSMLGQRRNHEFGVCSQKDSDEDAV